MIDMYENDVKFIVHMCKICPEFIHPACIGYHQVDSGRVLSNPSTIHTAMAGAAWIQSPPVVSSGLFVTFPTCTMCVCITTNLTHQNTTCTRESHPYKHIHAFTLEIFHLTHLTTPTNMQTFAHITPRVSDITCPRASSMRACQKNSTPLFRVPFLPSPA